MPGCCATRYLDAHHVVHWAEGGSTSLDNIVTLCRFHHRALHRGELSVEAHGPGRPGHFIFRRGDGHSLRPRSCGQSGDVSAETFRRRVQTLAPAIGPETAVTRWRGERCDYSMAVHGLLRRDTAPGASQASAR